MSSGTLYIVSAPSGAGKTSLVRALTQSLAGIHLSISHTTRAKRPGEHNGVDYYFVSHAEFETMVAKGRFLEHARVFDHYYGTAQAAVERLLTQGDVILEIDWQGARQVPERMPSSRSIFILPPSRAALEGRLRGRGQDPEEVIARRMQDAIAEMSHYDEADYLVINDEFSTALNELKAIVISQRLRLDPQRQRHRDLIADLLGGGP